MAMTPNPPSRMSLEVPADERLFIPAADTLSTYSSSISVKMDDESDYTHHFGGYVFQGWLVVTASAVSLTIIDRYLKTSMVKVSVGQGRPYLLHESLLVKASERMRNTLTKGFAEQQSKEIDLCEEDPALFDFFARYIYDRSIPSHSGLGQRSVFVLLADLYALGERLVSPGFQKVTFDRFLGRWNEVAHGDEELCELLEIASYKITPRKEEDIMRRQIFWYAACRLRRLRSCPRFVQMLDTVEGLAKEMAMRAGDSILPAPREFQDAPDQERLRSSLITARMLEDLDSSPLSSPLPTETPRSTLRQYMRG